MRVGSLAARAAQKPILWPLFSKPWLYSLGFTAIFRRSLLRLSDHWPKSKNINDSSQPCGHDQWFFLMAAVFGKIAYLNEPLAAYVQHGRNAYGWTKTGFLKSMKFNFYNRSYNASNQFEAADSLAVISELQRVTFRVSGATVRVLGPITMRDCLRFMSCGFCSTLRLILAIA